MLTFKTNFSNWNFPSRICFTNFSTRLAEYDRIEKSGFNWLILMRWKWEFDENCLNKNIKTTNYLYKRQTYSLFPICLLIEWVRFSGLSLLLIKEFHSWSIKEDSAVILTHRIIVDLKRTKRAEKRMSCVRGEEKFLYEIKGAKNKFDRIFVEWNERKKILIIEKALLVSLRMKYVDLRYIQI